jgi:threonine synthase
MTGMAEDGGLLLPETFPVISMQELRGKNYSGVAYEIIKHFADDIPPADLKQIIEKSYSNFDTEDVVAMAELKSCRLAELFHGPTYAFKDVALQLLGNLFEYILAKNGGQLNIIGATSGDTGSAAIYGVRGKGRIRICIFYPLGRVSEVQKLQMTTVPDDNVHTLEIGGTFDDCQSIVKTLFADLPFKRKYSLGAVNSINWARIMAQIVYYFYAYLQMPGGGVNFAVPTGNFGNIFAGYCAKRMGLPVDKLILATNSNNILHRFISAGDYSVKEVIETYSPAMDIQLASNFERYLYFLFGEDRQRLTYAMEELKKDKKISFSVSELSAVRDIFSSYAVDNSATVNTIKRVYSEDGYVADPHTACAIAAETALKAEPGRTITFATAHPAKFADVVKTALDFYPEEPRGLAALHGLPSRSTSAAADTDAVRKILEGIFK